MPEYFSPDTPLEQRQKQFCREYVIDMKPKAAAIRAGYDPASASLSAYKMLQTPKIQEEIKKEQAKLSKKTGITQERVLQELALIAFANPQDYVTYDESGNPSINIMEIPPEVAKSLEIEYSVSNGERRVSNIKIRQADRKDALIQIGKHLGMFKEQVDHKVQLTLEQLVLGAMKPAPEPAEIVQDVPLALPAPEDDAS